MILAWASPFNPVNTKYLYNICTLLNQLVQMLCKCFVFAGKMIESFKSSYLEIRVSCCINFSINELCQGIWEDWI